MIKGLLCFEVASPYPLVLALCIFRLPSSFVTQIAVKQCPQGFVLARGSVLSRVGGQVCDISGNFHLSQLSAPCTCRSDSLFTADVGGHRIDPQGIWRTDDMEAAVRRADTNPVDTKFGPPNIVRRGLLPCVHALLLHGHCSVSKSAHCCAGSCR